MLLGLIESLLFSPFSLSQMRGIFYSHLDNHTAVSVFDDIPKSK